MPQPGKIIEIVHVPNPGFVNIHREGSCYQCHICGDIHRGVETVWYHDTQRYERWVKKAEQFNKEAQ